MDNKDNNKKEKEIKSFLEDTFVDNSREELPDIREEKVDFGKTPVAGFINIPVENLPCGIFYKPGTKISIRSAKVKEVQDYSVVDDNNYIDITEKMNHLLGSCVKYIRPDNTVGSYKDIKDPDRIYLIFMIRELTFPGGKNLSKEVTCSHCKHEFDIEFRSTSSKDKKKTFVNYEMNDKLKKYFDRDDRVFKFTIKGEDYSLAPPNIGIQERFFSDIKLKVNSDKDPNVSFLKIIQFLLHDRTDITDEGIKKKESEFKSMDMESFQILNQAVNMMLFGIKELSTECPSCGQEVHTDMSFPSGASSLFVIPDAFDKYFGQ